ncbi:RNA polymerase, sigma-24 subunit, RpoE [Chthonomonas calidirosea]|uniref:RNA polymerase, sigma-24 subunit, RpoE n=1 Tax=Chthonomonas calidirosea (strain DSM 23976 / ICMP 18418 / T49) TaxID=1303518 RepID=S0EVJ3_CHTCT|nr:sigma-70 family RNA polymerase sigma factor [Chthonomonas calidirosea]CCW35816.1 RNA polymerase, sigma-24 subunit, RpoE [Chthonomonas calidirosea T49]CEK18134.1 RNA polymerase, sigma-24 subunit, RpoE [Chthonomonas calidirosea]CEK19160.1 RNA polymerase, sigma-24 subunit, RpoE [Chthonomonas calidirosea]
MTDADEQRLIERSKEGDRRAFDALVRMHEKRVYNLAYRLCGNYDEAGDITVEAFLRVYQAINSFRGDANFSTWLYRIVTNVYLDRRKRQKNRKTLSLEEYVELEESQVTRQIEDPSPGPEELAEAQQRQELLQKAIESLPEYQRAMIVLYHVDGLSYEEIAEVLSLPIGTVKSRLNRARLALREKLEPIREAF